MVVSLRGLMCTSSAENATPEMTSPRNLTIQRARTACRTLDTLCCRVNLRGSSGPFPVIFQDPVKLLHQVGEPLRIFFLNDRLSEILPCLPRVAGQITLPVRTETKGREKAVVRVRNVGSQPTLTHDRPRSVRYENSALAGCGQYSVFCTEQFHSPETNLQAPADRMVPLAAVRKRFSSHLFRYCDPPTVSEVLGFRTKAQLPVPL